MWIKVKKELLGFCDPGEERQGAEVVVVVISGESEELEMLEPGYYMG